MYLATNLMSILKTWIHLAFYGLTLKRLFQNHGGQNGLKLLPEFGGHDTNHKLGYYDAWLRNVSLRMLFLIHTYLSSYVTG